jgi:hypothetical protein
LYVEGLIGCVLLIGELITCVLFFGELITCVLYFGELIACVLVVVIGVVVRVWHCGEKLVFVVFCGNLLLFGTAVCFGHGSKQARKEGWKKCVQSKFHIKCVKGRRRRRRRSP